MDRSETKIICSISFDPDVLVAADTYAAELRGAGERPNRSALVNAALIEYVQRRREELAAREQAHA